MRHLHPHHLRRGGLALLGLFLAVAPLGATPPAPDPGQRPRLPLEARPAEDHGERVQPPGLGPFNYMREARKTLDFLAFWQFDQPGHPNHGGMIEAEAGPLGGVIQTDNTLEAIWCWSWWRQRTGRESYHEQVLKAWIYCERWPAWLEEGAPGDNYYRVHNCAWALAAVRAHEAASGDTTKRAYAETCAEYIAAHPLPLGNDPLNALVAGWAAGSLYQWAEALGDEPRMEAALAQARLLRDWVDIDPQTRLAIDYWAMSGGTMLWGLAASLGRAEGLPARFWLHRNARHAPAWTDWHNVGGYNWDSAWNVAYANGHFETRLAAGDPMEWALGRETTDALLSWDSDDDGGIMADSQDPVTEDMSWVSCYLLRFGVSRLIGQPPARDIAPLRFVGLENGQLIEEGQALDLRLVVANHGLEGVPQATVVLGGDLPGAAAESTVPFAANDTLDFGPWTPAGPGVHLLEARTALAGDTVPANDTLRLRIRVLPAALVQRGGSADGGQHGDESADPTGQRRTPSPAPHASPGAGPAAEPTQPLVRLRPLDGGIRFQLEGTGAARIAIYDLLGRPVAELRAEGSGPSAVLHWDGRSRGRPVAAGVYLWRLEGGGEPQAGTLRVGW